MLRRDPRAQGFPRESASDAARLGAGEDLDLQFGVLLDKVQHLCDLRFHPTRDICAVCLADASSDITKALGRNGCDLARPGRKILPDGRLEPGEQDALGVECPRQEAEQVFRREYRPAAHLSLIHI